MRSRISPLMSRGRFRWLGRIISGFEETNLKTFNVLLTVHLNVFISVFNQLHAQNLFYNKFYFMPLHVSSTCAHHQEVKIALHSLLYHHTYRWPSRARDGHQYV